jgi:hypothetical protein
MYDGVGREPLLLLTTFLWPLDAFLEFFDPYGLARGPEPAKFLYPEPNYLLGPLPYDPAPYEPYLGLLYKFPRCNYSILLRV